MVFNVNLVRIGVENVNFFYGQKQELKDLSFNIFDKKVTAIIGPSG